KSDDSRSDPGTHIGWFTIHGTGNGQKILASSVELIDQGDDDAERRFVEFKTICQIAKQVQAGAVDPAKDMDWVARIFSAQGNDQFGLDERDKACAGQRRYGGKNFV